jgi:hypothetical protein
MVSLFLLQYKAVGVSYMLDKSRLSIRFLPPYSGEGRKKTANMPSKMVQPLQIPLD